MAEAERTEKARRMGRAWQCLRCHYREQKRTVDRKGRIEDHIMKVHLALEEVPFYCRLCLFRCQKKEQLKNHVTAHKRHVEMAAKRQITDHESCLVSNVKPHVMGPMDYVALSAEASLEHFLQTQGNGKPSTIPVEAEQEVPLIELTEEQLAQVLQSAEAGQVVTVVQPEDTSQVPLVLPTGVQTTVVNQQEAGQALTVPKMPAAQTVQVTPTMNLQAVANPVGTQMPVTHQVGAVQMAVQGQQIQMQSAMPKQPVQSWSSVPESLGAMQPTTMLAQDIQRYPSLNEVLNTIIGTQQLLLATCEQRTMIGQNSYHQGPSTSKPEEPFACKPNPASHPLQMPVKSAPSTVPELVSKSDVVTVNDLSGTTPVSVHVSNLANRTPLDLSVNGPNHANRKEISIMPLDLTFKPNPVTEKKSQEEVPTTKEKVQPKEKQQEEVIKESDSEETDTETEEENSENVMDQLLPEEDMTIKSPVKRKIDSPESTERERKQLRKEQAQKTETGEERKIDLPVNVKDLSERTLVTVVDTFRVAMENNARVVKENNELLRENMMLTAKMIDTMTRLQRSMEEQMKGEGKHDEWTRDDEGKKRELERREVDRSRESWRESQRRPEERRREDLRRVIERHDRDGRRRGDGERQREKENEVLKSVENKNRR